MNHICHFEIGCRDRAKAAAFYSKMFEWKMEDHGASTGVRTGADVGGHLNALGHEPHNYTIFYVMVDDVATALAKAVSLGDGGWWVRFRSPMRVSSAGSRTRRAT